MFWHKKPAPKTVMCDPYRTPAPMPVEPPPPKPKRQFKMPSIKFSKSFKVFGLLIPVCATLVAIGLLYDSPILGIGLKWGTALALSVEGAFFAVKAFCVIDSSD